MAKRKREADGAAGEGDSRAKKKLVSYSIQVDIAVGLGDHANAWPKSAKQSRGARKAITNNDRPPKVSLLGMPGEIRNRIYRLSLIEPSLIFVKSKRSAVEPGLLRTCRILRKEATPIFHHENIFRTWVRKCRIAGKRYHWLWKLQGVPCERIGLVYEGKPSWSALKAWARIYRRNKMKGMSKNVTGQSRALRICCQAFEIADLMGHAPWKSVDDALEALKKAVDTADPRKLFDD